MTEQKNDDVVWVAKDAEGIVRAIMRITPEGKLTLEGNVDAAVAEFADELSATIHDRFQNVADNAVRKFKTQMITALTDSL